MLNKPWDKETKTWIFSALKRLSKTNRKVVSRAKKESVFRAIKFARSECRKDRNLYTYIGFTEKELIKLQKLAWSEFIIASDAPLDNKAACFEEARTRRESRERSERVMRDTRLGRRKDRV